MYGQGVQYFSLLFTLFVVRDPDIEVSTIILVDSIAIGAENFHVGLSDVVRHVEGVDKDLMGRGGIWKCRQRSLG